MNEFENMVYQMRVAQREYRQSKQRAALDKAESLGRAIDKYLKEKIDGKT